MARDDSAFPLPQRDAAVKESRSAPGGVQGDVPPGRLHPEPRYHPKDPRAVELQVSRLYHEANKVLEEAVSPEKLKDNPYRGKPLRFEENPFEGDLGMAHRLLKNTGHTLPWIATKKEIIDERRAIEQAIDDHIAWVEQRVARYLQLSSGEAEPPGPDASPQAEPARRFSLRALLPWRRRPGAKAGAGPAPLEEKERLRRDVLEGHSRFVEHLRERVAGLRKVIERYNLEVPLFDQQLPNVRPEEYAARVEARARDLLARLGAGAER
ncbi:MAG: DUF1992 domain-containing protein [Clostridia bacterium]